MKMISDPAKDVRTIGSQPGAYEWWYFDAISSGGRFSLVVIFYEGNPFSTRYNSMIGTEGHQPSPSDFPAVSISIYEGNAPIYYSFTEFEQADAIFDEDKPYVKVGGHQMEMVRSEERLLYKLTLEESLPSGDKIGASIVFDSPDHRITLFDKQGNNTTGHCWNLVQPRAVVKADIRLEARNEDPTEIRFEGTGYHDHNMGREPMQREFSDWYWGRFHFEFGTLVYYVMNRENDRQHQAWLIGKNDGQLIDSCDIIELEDKGYTLFGLKTARKLQLMFEDTEVHVQQSHLLDNGPFYQRYLSDAFVRRSSDGMIGSQIGITEYIRPGRISARIFWPFVDMRIRYTKRGPHWVQRSKKLYRWTW
jgi:carotenoid 1,2-hydratase